MNSTDFSTESAPVSEVEQLRERLHTATFEARFYRGLAWALLAAGACGTFLFLLNR